MPPKPITPNNATASSNTRSIITRANSSALPSNSDIMAALQSLREEFLSSNINLSSTQTSQFKEIKNDLKQLSNQILELKAENTNLRNELEILKNKVTSLEDANPSDHYSHVVSQVLQESFERDRCSMNTIVYGVPESSSSSTTQRIIDDGSALCALLGPHNINIPINSKMIRLGKICPDKARPLKILCGSKDSATKLISDFKASVKNGDQFPAGFRIVSDKTLLQRKLLRSCHLELETRRLNGELNLEISYINGVPQVRIANSKNLRIQPQTRHL